MTLHLTLKMTTAQVVETSVTNNSLSKDYLHLDDHAKQITDTPGFKPFTNIQSITAYNLLLAVPYTTDVNRHSSVHFPILYIIRWLPIFETL